MPLMLWGNSVLDRVCEPVDAASLGPAFRGHCERMLRVMHAAGGAGLAAP